jgi:hypothetical protein
MFRLSVLHSSNLKMEAGRSSEASGLDLTTALRLIPENNLLCYHRENFRCHKERNKDKGKREVEGKARRER